MPIKVAADRADNPTMSTRSLTHVAVLALTVSFFSSCSSTEPTRASAVVEAPEPPAAAYEEAVQSGEAFTLVVMRRGNALEVITPEELGLLTSQHMEFMGAMSESGYLLASGPAIAPRAESSLRSFGFVDSSQAEDVLNQVCGDPAASAGVLDVEAMPFLTKDNLRALPAMGRALAMDRSTDEPAMRPYVIAEVPTSAAMSAMVDRMGDLVVFSGDCVGGSFADATLVVMDCRTASEARELMAVLGDGSADFVYHPWVAPVALAQMN